MNYIVSKKWTNKTGGSGTSYYMGTIDIPMMGQQLQTSAFIKDAKRFNSVQDASKVLSMMGKNAIVEPID